MSINNQMLIKEHKGQFYVFDVMAESWGEFDEDGNLISKTNYLPVERAKAVCNTREEAHKVAHKLDSKEMLSAEYGVIDEKLAKDGAEVVFVEDTQNE